MKQGGNADAAYDSEIRTNRWISALTDAAAAIAARSKPVVLIVVIDINGPVSGEKKEVEG